MPSAAQNPPPHGGRGCVSSVGASRDRGPAEREVDCQERLERMPAAVEDAASGCRCMTGTRAEGRASGMDANCARSFFFGARERVLRGAPAQATGKRCGRGGGRASEPCAHKHGKDRGVAAAPCPAPPREANVIGVSARRCIAIPPASPTIIPNHKMEQMHARRPGSKCTKVSCSANNSTSKWSPSLPS